MNFKIKKIINYVLIILLILDIPLILYFFNFNNFAFNENFHKEEFEKLDVYDELKGYDIEKINNDVLLFLKNKNINLADNNFFNEREKEHLEDVKVIIQFIIGAYYTAIVVFFVLITLLIILNKNIESITKYLGLILFFAGSLALFELIASYYIFSNYFEEAFNLMHSTFFPVGTFVFDSAVEKIVVLYPEQFFYNILISMIANTIKYSLILIIIGAIILIICKKMKKQ